MIADLTGKMVGDRYQVQRQLGVGGMGVVYQAFDRLSRQMVALKRVATPSGDGSPEFDLNATSTRMALANEFQVLAVLHHPHIIRVLDYGFDAERLPYFTMNYLENASPITRFGDGQPRDTQIRLIVEMLQALAYLHQHGIVHRDLKPDNALVTSEGDVKVLDFGLATLHEHRRQSDEISGTIAYIAPEVFQGAPASAAVDLYAVGVIAYEMLAGRHPFDATNPSKLIMDILYTPIDFGRLNAEAGLQGVIARLLEKSPGDRYSDAHEVLGALRGVTTAPIQIETRAIRESFLQAARFVGREKELSRLTEALAEALNHRGSAWLIGGESGVGKSRLLDELRTRGLVQGMIVLRGQGVKGGGFSYQLWREPLRRLVLSSDLDDADASVLDQIVTDIDELLGRPLAKAPELAGQAGQDRFMSAIVGLFNKHTQPILLILEDLEWAEESLEVLQRLIPIVQDLPLLIVGSYRSEERANLPELLPGMQLIRLERLDAMGIAELSESMLGSVGGRPEVIDLLKRETEGNAFFLVEVVRALAEQAGSLKDIQQMELPAQVLTGGVQQVVSGRLRRLPAYARPLLEMAAVHGRRVDLKLLAAVNSDFDLESWLTDCSNAAVLDVIDDEWRFAHEKLREGIVGGLTDSQSQTLHRQVANALQQVHAQQIEEYAPMVAGHYEAAGDLPQALQWYVRAGKYADETYAPAMAILYYRKALALWSHRVDAVSLPLPLTDIYERLGEVLNWRASYGEAIEAFNEMLRAAEASQDPIAQINAWYGIARAQTYQGDMHTALESATRSHEMALSVDARLEIARAMWMKGWILFRLGNGSAAQQLAEQVLQLSQAQENPSLIGNSHNLLGALYISSGRFEDAARSFESAHVVFEKLGDRLRDMTIVNNLGWLAETRGDYDLAFARYENALNLARQVGNRSAEMVYLSNLGGMRVLRGDYAGAANDLNEVIEMVGDGGLDVLSETYRFLSEAYLRQGQDDEALAAAQRALALGHEVGAQDYVAAAWRGLGLVAAAQGHSVFVVDPAASQQRWHEAAECFAESLRIARENEMEAEKARTLRAWAQEELAHGDAARGEAMWWEARDVFTRLGALLEAERMANLPHQRSRIT